MKRARGFSLVELMIAITLALFVSVGVVSVFVGSRSAYQATSGTASSTDGGRFALDFIESSVRDAGFMACSRSVSQTSLLNPGATPLYFSFNEALGGYEAAGTGPAGGAYTLVAGSPTAPIAPDTSAADWVGGLDAALTAPALVIKGNDVLVVRSTLQNTQPVYVTSIVDGANNFTVTTQGGLVPGELAVISDCADSLAMQITAIAPSGANFIITHTAGGGPGQNSTPSFLPLSFQVGSQVTAVDTTVYYIGTGADGDGALFSYDLNGTTTFTANELVPDIEAMQVLYGLDTTGAQAVTNYVTADLVPDFNSVMSVKVAVLAASPPGATQAPSVAPTYNLLGTTVTAPIDTRARKVFETTIAVRNALL
jgi:type IV pilus assembly protein PilW